MHDVIVVGASFAGLAVANQLRDFRVLLVDRKAIGSGQTSACGTIQPVMAYWNLTGAILQVHDQLVLHTRRNTIPFPSPYRWCTFDYRQACKTLFSRSNADFLRAAVTAYEPGRIHTTQGSYEAQILVDASGWRAVLASAAIPLSNGHGSMSFGIETIARQNGVGQSEGLHFYYQPAILPQGVGWVFPRGDTVSIGLGSYRGARSLHHALSRFGARFGVNADEIRGTYFPSKLRSPTAGPVFVVGDAAGQCIGLTGEGIRPALFFGEACGRILAGVLKGQLTLEDGLAAYRKFVADRRLFFNVFSVAQDVLSRVPADWIDWVARLIQHDRVRPWVLAKYWGLTKAWDARLHGTGVDGRKDQ